MKVSQKKKKKTVQHLTEISHRLTYTYTSPTNDSQPYGIKFAQVVHIKIIIKIETITL